MRSGHDCGSTNILQVALQHSKYPIREEKKGVKLHVQLYVF